MEVVSHSVMLILVYQTAWHYIPDSLLRVNMFQEICLDSCIEIGCYLHLKKILCRSC
jgi:hypothetical protein